VFELTPQSFADACRRGGAHIEAWLRVVDREHGARFYREAAAALRCWQAGEDVVQEAMVKVWERCATFRGTGDPMAWIHQVVRNTLLDALRRNQPNHEPLQGDDGEAPSAEVQEAVAGASRERVITPEQWVDAAQREAVFAECFARFASAYPEHAQVLRWVVEDGLENADVEALLGRTPGATRQFISQCRIKSRPFFAPWYALVGAE
jgi:RNA polymerase sigma-70 factor (ECF subfamily)